MEQDTKTLKDYLAVLRRRKTQFAMVAGTLFVIAWAVAWWLPSVYRSTATIMIEQQEIPSDLVRSTISSYADGRIQVISQQTMSRASLMHIIEKYGLYGADKTGKATAGKVERLRKNVNLELVKVDVTDAHSGNKIAATIAFNLSYDGESAELAQKVAAELVALFVNASIKERQEQVAETSTFFAGEAEKLSARISQTESKLAAFKARNMGRLPEQVQLTLQQRERTDGEIRDVERQLNVLEERKFSLEAQLAQVKPIGPLVSATGERILDEAERLKLLQARYSSLAGVYSNDHPDMIKMRREIEALQGQAGAANELDEQAKQLTRLRAELITARDRYSEDHPDIIRLKKSIAALEASAARPSPGGARARDTKPDNPAFITLRSQLDATDNELKSLRNKRVELKSSIVALESRLAQAPQVEREYLDLARDHDNSLKRYEEIRGKQMQAQISQQLERDSKGERFTLLDPPQLPEQPHSPNRLAIVFLGMLLSVGGGAAYAGVRESLDESIHGSSALAAVSKVPLLAQIPYIESERQDDQMRQLRQLGLTSLPAVLAAALTLTLSSATQADRPVSTQLQVDTAGGAAAVEMIREARG
jgi:succinoglycan biosynthesis transport protein ExoP